MIIMGERKRQGEDLIKEYLKIYSYVLACKPSLIRVNSWNLVSLAFAKVLYFPIDPNDLNFLFMQFSTFYFT